MQPHKPPISVGAQHLDLLIDVLKRRARGRELQPGKTAEVGHRRCPIFERHNAIQHKLRKICAFSDPNKTEPGRYLACGHLLRCQLEVDPAWCDIAGTGEKLVQ